MEKHVQEYITYLTPEYIYIPYDNESLLTLNKNRLVYHNMNLGTNNDGNIIFCPVSGKVIGIKEMEFNNKKSNTLVIMNDYKDKRERLNPSRNMNKVKKTDIVASLQKYNLNKKINSKTTLVVNSLYDKNYDLKDMVINYESYEGILEAIDEFMSIFNMKNCYICIPKSDLYSISAYEKYINAFMNICIVHSNKKFKDNNCVFYSIEEILAIYKAIHLDYMYDNTIITINNGKSTIVKVKLYTSLYEVLKALKITYKGKKILVNNKEINDVKDFVIDSSIRNIIIKD